MTELETVVVHSEFAHEFFAFGDDGTANGSRQSRWQIECSSWYMHHLLERINAIEKRDSAEDELARVFKQHLTTDPEEDGTARLFSNIVLDAMRAVATQLTACSSETTIHGICLSLVENHILKNPADDGAHQLVFTLIGWITQLYEPHPTPRRGVIEPLLSRNLDPSSARGRRRRHFRQNKPPEMQASDCDNPCQQTITFLLPFYGFALPQRQPARAFASPPNINRSDTFYIDTIVASNINYYSLNRIGSIKVRWTASICEHLDFDEQSRCLLLFAHPAFCAYMCSKDSTAVLLDRFFRQYMEFIDHQQVDSEQIFSEDYYCEILWTFRVLFSQDEKSWKDLRYLCETSRPAGNSDPLLSRLISHGWRKATSSTITSMLNDLNIPALKSVYSAGCDFPYLGDKLLVLQDYMNAQNPGDLRTLRHDRRDVLKYWTFWAVFIVGGISIVISFLQLLLTLAQVAGQYKG